MIKLCFLFFTALPARAVRALPVTACDILGRSIFLVTLVPIVLGARLASFWEPPTPIRGWRCSLALGERLSPPPDIGHPSQGCHVVGIYLFGSPNTHMGWCYLSLQHHLMLYSQCYHIARLVFHLPYCHDSDSPETELKHAG